MPSLTIIEQGALACSHAHCPSVALYGVAFAAAYDDALVLCIEAYNAEHHPVTLGELAQLLTRLVEEVEVVVAILLALQDKLVRIPGEEHDGVLRLHILRIGLAVELCDALTRGGIVAHQAAVVLVTVELKDIDSLRIGAPRHVGEVAVLGVTSLQVDGLVGRHIIYAHGHLVRGLSRHGVLVGLVSGNMGEKVHLRIVGYHTLVHTIEGETHTIGTPEKTTVDAKLIAMHALSVDDLARAIGGELYVLATIGRAHIELVATHISRVTRCSVEVACLVLIRTALLPYNLLLLKVDELSFTAKVEQHQRLVAVGEASIVESTQTFFGCASQPLVDLLNR